ncbi:MAG: YjfB family protein [Ectothiorhodospiraceae bacterium]
MVDVSGIASAASGASQAQAQADVQTSVMRKALDVQQSGGEQMIGNLEAANAQGAEGSAGSPPNPSERVGGTIDTSV